MHDELGALTARRPVTTFSPSLTEKDVDHFWESGFVSIDRITTDEELAWLGEVYDLIFKGETAAFRSASWDLVRPIESDGADRLPQVIHPELRYPVLKETLLRRNGRRLAAQLMDLDERLLEGWGHMIYKPARIGEPLPWHQDEAYWDPTLVYRALGCWMPLDDATPENGAMKFIPGSHKSEVRQHHHLNDDPTTPALYVDVTPEDEARAVTLPVAAGGAIFHHSRTLHASGPNRSARERRAYANEWQLSPQQARVAADRPWVEESRRAMAEIRARRG